MSVLKRAFLYITRKKAKSIIMFFILFGIATSMIAGFAIKSATKETRKNINSAIGASFEIGVNLQNNFGVGERGLGNVPGSIVDKVRTIEGITSNDLRTLSEVDLMGLKKVPLKNERYGYSPEQEEKLKTMGDLQGNEDTSLDNKFVGGALKLTSGRHIKKGDVNKVLVHEEFAKLNNLKLGSKFKVKASQYRSINQDKELNDVIELEVVGMFTGSNQDRAMHEVELIENILMSDITTATQISGCTRETLPYQDAKFYVKDASKMPEILEKLKKLDFDWEKYTVRTSNKNFMTLTTSLDAMDRLINQLIVGSIVISSIILSLVLAFWINGRIHETGVLLSLGISKSNIVAQYIAELLMIAVFSFGASIGSGMMIAQKLGDSLVKQANDAGRLALGNSLGGMNLGADAESSLIAKTLDTINVTIGAKEFMWVWIMGIAIIIISVAISSMNIIKLKPKEILSKMS
ncbi:FtsX-like permease family protein [Tuanshanicoccus lijuaniae]|uniref:FtsX-like permease family protein n=1 Tax=Aerococcaceae bacterium zg-1292 TaxID=2774330 RepID=UPI0019389562|nr:FtsX-like permease family protein [Aerococcaceae bacterium zg-1292]MBF6625947.1 FtsX-like permease family protein [Aerococcaceae bacterium zg-BR9]MBF6978473.1 FtsX-like permease family protein [Aerococcaceae bacterium zg-BR22]MBS4455455.1 FtsX-like permease family protein [Aerococcaceae bacterium zg-A91]MBS4457074.1 FtsX-like permease family protein [Aerococcaceae bacterium zg-BR33]